MSVAVIPMAAELGWSASDRGLVCPKSVAHACMHVCCMQAAHFADTCMHVTGQQRLLLGVQCDADPGRLGVDQVGLLPLLHPHA